MSGTTELNKSILEQLADVVEYLDKRGFVLAVVKKPRNHTYMKMYDADTGYIDNNTRFGATKVREFRVNAGLTISQLAEDLGVDRNIVRRMERDNLTHTYKSMKRFADYFGCSVEDLIEDKWTD